MTHPLLRAILENPADTDARRVFADYLEESGQEDRAEFVRAQIALAEESHEPAVCNVTGVCGACNRVMGMRRRERELWAGENNRHWSAGLPGNYSGWISGTTTVSRWFDGSGGKLHAEYTFRRGFVEVVHSSTADFLAHGPAIVLAQPVMEVVLSDREPSEYNRTFGWFDDRRQGGWQRGPHYLPAAIYDLIEWEFDHEAATSSLKTRADALSALSHACVTWARAQAGLPAFPGNDFP